MLSLPWTLQRQMNCGIIFREWQVWRKKMSDPKRLHPIAVLLNIIKSIKELVIPFLLVVVIPGKNEGIPGWIQPLVIAIIILLIIGNAFLQWLRFTYRIEEGEFRIESGVFVRKKRYIKFDRIHSIDISEGIIQ